MEGIFACTQQQQQAFKIFFEADYQGNMCSLRTQAGQDPDSKHIQIDMMTAT